MFIAGNNFQWNEESNFVKNSTGLIPSLHLFLHKGKNSPSIKSGIVEDGIGKQVKISKTIIRQHLSTLNDVVLFKYQIYATGSQSVFPNHGNF